MPKLRQTLEHFLSLDPSKQSRWTSLLIYQIRLYIQIARQLVKDNCLQQAASLAYSTILSIIPIVALLFSMFQSFANLKKYETQLHDFLQKHLLAESAASAFDKIKEFSQKISGMDDVVSSVFFLLFSLMLFNTIEGTINYIWKVKRARSLFDRFITYWILVTLGPVFIILSLQLSNQIEKITYLGTIFTTIMNLFPMAIIALALIFAYKLVPNTKVQWKAAIIGGIVAGILFELAKSGFNMYILRLKYYESIYTSLYILVFFLLWVYVAWIIVLFGTEVSYTIQNLAYLVQKDREDKLRLKKMAEQSVVNDILGLRIFWRIARSYHEGSKVVTSDDLSDQFSLSLEVVEEVIRRLEERNLVIGTAQPANGIIPAKSLNHIQIKDIVASFQIEFPLSHPAIPIDGGDAIDATIAKMDTARLDIVANKTVGDLVSEMKK